MPKNTVRINVSKDVRNRLNCFGGSYKTRVDEILSQNLVINFPVKDKVMQNLKPMFISGEAYLSLTEAKQALGCSSLSNVLESLLNSNPVAPLKVEAGDSSDTEPANSALRIKKSDRIHLALLGKEHKLSQHNVVTMLLDFWEDSLV